MPTAPYRLPGAGRDGVLRGRDGMLERLVHVAGEPATVRAWVAGGAVRLRGEAATREAAGEAVARMRFALGVDHDLRPFQRAFHRDPLLGPVIRRRPWLRPRRRPEPFEALAWAVTEQLIDVQRAFAIQRRIVARHGPRGPDGLRDVPGATAVAGLAPAELDACGLAPKRSIALIRAAREVARGRADLTAHEPSWRRLRTIPNIGSWTLEYLAFAGQGRDDQIPAGDLAYVKLVGALAGVGRRATEQEVRAFFAPYAPYQALAGIYALHAPHEPLRG
ncbi:MAG: DNA-3-methyladenine glycosylase 2 family protein [Solirubrobacterales bacterium]|nr:DNA-3-methyladenine glycosylase 2 family protein [Solirubrobacterales bacterium]